MSKPVRRFTLALLLGLSLAPGSHAAVSGVQQDLVPFTARLVELAVQFFWGDEKHGCGLDPYGRCIPQATTATDSEHGCTIDPYGRCLPQATTSTDSEHGCTIDPFGRPIGNCQGN